MGDKCLLRPKLIHGDTEKEEGWLVARPLRGANRGRIVSRTVQTSLQMANRAEDAPESLSRQGCNVLSLEQRKSVLFTSSRPILTFYVGHVFSVLP